MKTARRWYLHAFTRHRHDVRHLPPGPRLLTGAAANASRVADPARSNGVVCGPNLLAPDDTVLVMDGELVVGRASAELYDPGTGRWAVTARPAHARHGYSLTRLADGTVLLVGDYDYESEATSELYVPGGGS